jgi:outer membrane lipoprotein SlyB
MTRRLQNMERSIVFVLAVAMVTGCAAPAPQTLDTSQPAPSSGAQMALGVVASVRSVGISGGQIGAMAGVNAVLGALSQQAMAPPLAGEEIVIRKDDGDTAAIVEPDQTPSLAAGDRVALIASSPAVIIHRN